MFMSQLVLLLFVTRSGSNPKGRAARISPSIISILLLRPPGADGMSSVRRHNARSEAGKNRTTYLLPGSVVILFVGPPLCFWMVRVVQRVDEDSAMAMNRSSLRGIPESIITPRRPIASIRILRAKGLPPKNGSSSASFSRGGGSPQR